MAKRGMDKFKASSNEKQDIITEIKAARKQRLEDLTASLAEYNPDAILLEPREMYDHAILGYSMEGRAVYSYTQIISMLSEDDETSVEDAVDHFDYNIAGTFVPMDDPNKPIFMYEE